MTSPAIDYPPARVEHVASGTWLTQTWALFVDAYRELNARKLFWITLVLSVLVVVAFAFVSINERGVKIFGSEFPGAWNTNFIPEATFYKFIFTEIAIPWWLGVIAAILALISVCSVFPDFVSGGSIDLYLSKPIGRLRLFLTKYVSSLLFVALQVFVFALGCFLLIGLRSGSWEFGIFLAVPLVTLFFSYLFCVCVLVGILTRSPLASLLITILFWLGLFSVQATESTLLMLKTTQDERVQAQKRLIESNERIVAQSPNAEGFKFQLEEQRRALPEFQNNLDRLTWWHNAFAWAKVPLPKTGETVQLMSRWLVEPEPLMRAQEESQARQEERRAARRAERERERAAANATTTPAATAPAPPPPGRATVSAEFNPEDPAVARRVRAELGARAATRIIGSSLLFEAAVLAIAAWVFCRRDF